jgi:hypothetical protein
MLTNSGVGGVSRVQYEMPGARARRTERSGREGGVEIAMTRMADWMKVSGATLPTALCLSLPNRQIERVDVPLAFRNAKYAERYSAITY